jgi:hypothetical protein
MKNVSKKITPTDAFVGGFVSIIGITCAGWWIFDHAMNQEYYSVLGQKESVVKNNYEKLRMVSHQNAEGLSLEMKKQIRDEIGRRESNELQQVKALVDRQFGRRE